MTKNENFLQKSRVIGQQPGERNFHSFYQLLMGSTEQTLSKLGLKRDANHYHYLKQGGSPKVNIIHEK